LRFVARVAFAGFLTLSAGTLTLAQPSDRQPPESIREAARAFVRQRLEHASVANVEAVGVDDRVRLPACTVPLTAHAQSELRGGTGTVAVSCTGAQPWRLYVPVRTATQTAAVVTRRAIQPGEPITAADVALESRSTTALPYEYLTAAEEAVGATARRTIPAGAVLVPAALKRAVAIERGALVTLVSRSGTVVVKTEGIALAPAQRGERVRVRSQSGRVVEGIAAAANEVHVGS
jgi:flagella basal body P-ring formation protein FlgA